MDSTKNSSQSSSADPASGELAPNERKKRSRSTDEIGHNGDGGSAICGQDSRDNGQKDTGAEINNGLHEHKRRQRRLSGQDDEMPQLRNMKIKRLRLEAIFHPKFENESSEKDVRNEMLSRVAEGGGYLEVTLKHSGSLLLWSGGSRFYSKNDANNLFTLVGEFLLRRHMALVWGEGFHQSSNENVHDSSYDSKSKYDECGDFLEEHRLTLAFEVVSSVLGDHGDVPKHPYLILLSVADRSKQQFYTSHQLIKLAQKFRLPHNDYWMFATQSSCHKLFQFYDDIREIGTANTVVRGLDQLVDGYDENHGPRTRKIVSMYPHVEYQGDILEGLVIRFVEYGQQISDDDQENTRDRLLQSLNDLARISESQLAIMANAKATDSSSSSELGNYFSSDGRKNADTDRRLRSFLKNQSAKHDYQRLVRATGTQKRGEWEVSSWILSSFECKHEILDRETKQIIQLIQRLKEFNVKIEYKLYRQSELLDGNAEQINEKVRGLQNQRWVCVVHVVHDETFKKYSRLQNLDSMQLFRGFSFELDFSEKSDCQNACHGSVSGQSVRTTFGGFNNPLMLKMKFLPYMVRTFGCRNGLRILSRSGIEGYEKYTLDLLNRWGMSHGAIKRWQPYFYSWGLYAESILRQQQMRNDARFKTSAEHCNDDQKHFPVERPVEVIDPCLLSEDCFLTHLSTFESLYHSGQMARFSDGESKFNGLLIVLSLTREQSVALGAYLSSKLGIRHQVHETGSISEVMMLSSLVGNGQNAILCNTVVDDSQAPIKKLLKKKQFEEAISIVFFGCSQEDIDQHYGKEKVNDNKRVSGLTRSWSRSRCKKIFHLPKMLSSAFEARKETADIVAELIELSAPLQSENKRPGILVFFPGIPGCGKSSLCRDDSYFIESAITQYLTERNHLDLGEGKRPVIICEGDKVKGKYWRHVLEERLQNTSAIYLADKNATPIVWDTVGEICVKSLALPVVVLPDSMAFCTVTVEHSHGKDCYPYSLSYLAICMLRVLMRQDGTHIGKLDRSTKNALMVVVMFYSLYRGITAENMLSLINVGNVNCTFTNGAEPVITVPFFIKNDHSDIPQELRDCLVEALHMQVE
eukprot:CCRYP_007402-RA/>CCRYP_007402-RA protein AED:0.00 eAED:0.00 QI:1964/1/1/1/1/1/3/1185/1091